MCSVETFYSRLLTLWIHYLGFCLRLSQSLKPRTFLMCAVLRPRTVSTAETTDCLRTSRHVSGWCQKATKPVPAQPDAAGSGAFLSLLLLNELCGQDLRVAQVHAELLAVVHV